MTNTRIDRLRRHFGTLWVLVLLGSLEANGASPASPAVKSRATPGFPATCRWTQSNGRAVSGKTGCGVCGTSIFPGVLDGSFMTVENGATFRNLLRAAGLEEGGALARIWSDGDCYLVLDTVSRLYAYRPDDYLKGKLDYWIPIIARVQREDGLVDTWTVLKRFDAKDGKLWERSEKAAATGRLSGIACLQHGTPAYRRENPPTSHRRRSLPRHRGQGGDLLHEPNVGQTGWVSRLGHAIHFTHALASSDISTGSKASTRGLVTLRAAAARGSRSLRAQHGDGSPLP